MCEGGGEREKGGESPGLVWAQVEKPLVNMELPCVYYIKSAVHLVFAHFLGECERVAMGFPHTEL